MPNIDLHMHSLYSDGNYTPSQLATYAKQKGLSAISLTDHDTIDGLNEARKQSEILRQVELYHWHILPNIA